MRPHLKRQHVWHPGPGSQHQAASCVMPSVSGDVDLP